MYTDTQQVVVVVRVAIEQNAFAVGLLVFGLIGRSIAWWTVGVETYEAGAMDSLYRSALDEHFFEFVTYTHTKPLGHYIRHFLALRFFGPAHVGFGNLLFTTIVDMVAITLLFDLLLYVLSE